MGSALRDGSSDIIIIIISSAAIAQHAGAYTRLTRRVDEGLAKTTGVALCRVLCTVHGCTVYTVAFGWARDIGPCMLYEGRWQSVGE